MSSNNEKIMGGTSFFNSIVSFFKRLFNRINVFKNFARPIYRAKKQVPLIALSYAALEETEEVHDRAYEVGSAAFDGIMTRSREMHTEDTYETPVTVIEKFDIAYEPDFVLIPSEGNDEPVPVRIKKKEEPASPAQNIVFEIAQAPIDVEVVEITSESTARATQEGIHEVEIKKTRKPRKAAAPHAKKVTKATKTATTIKKPAKKKSAATKSRVTKKKDVPPEAMGFGF